jgi:diguanylate cyclase (GGDEF)-like protein
VDRQDEIGRLMASYAGMFETIERQAGELRDFGVRLETANRALETANTELKDLSFKDELTGLYNRRFFWLRLSEEGERCARFKQRGAVLLLDLDGFKAVNDECGHPAGDETLRQVADVLLRHSRGVDVVARLGGDEFALLLPQTEEAGARRCAERIREALGEHRFAHGRPITTSIGMAALGMASGSGEDVMRVADDALYQAKRAGKNAIRLGTPDLGLAEPLFAEGDFDRLLELIVTKAREATAADAGSLYLVEDPASADRVLRFVVAQNDSRAVRVEDIRLPVGHGSVAGYVAATGKVINIADAYDLAPDAEFRINPEMDRRLDYRTVSMLGVPLIDQAGQVTGVLQLINKKRSPRIVLETPEVAVAESRAFGNADQQVVVALATLAAVAIRGRRAEEARARLEAELRQRNL